MPHLQCLSLRANLRSRGSLYHRSFVTCMAAWRELQHLDLQDFVVYSFVDLRHILMSLPKLRSLSLSGRRLIHASSTLMASPRVDSVRAPRLRFLSLSTGDFVFLSLFLGCLTSTSICSEVRALELFLGFGGPEIPGLVDSLVKAAGLFLRVLTLSVSTPLKTGMDRYSSIQTSKLTMHILRCLPSLLYNTKLMYLRLSENCVVVDADSPIESVARAFQRLLANISSTSLFHLDVEIYFRRIGNMNGAIVPSQSTEDFLKPVDVRDVHALATQPKFQSLGIARVRFNIPDDGTFSRRGIDHGSQALDLGSRTRYILQPWDDRRILGVTLSNFRCPPSEKEAAL